MSTEFAITRYMQQNPDNLCECGHALTHHSPKAFGRTCERTACVCAGFTVPEDGIRRLIVPE